MGLIFKPPVVVIAVLLLVGMFNPQPDAPASQAATAQGAATHRHVPPQRPQETVEIPPLARSARTVHVKAGDSLQAALDAAAPGDRLTLEPGATYQGPFRLPRKEGDGWIVIAT